MNSKSNFPGSYCLVRYTLRRHDINILDILKNHHWGDSISIPKKTNAVNTLQVLTAQDLRLSAKIPKLSPIRVTKKVYHRSGTQIALTWGECKVISLHTSMSLNLKETLMPLYAAAVWLRVMWLGLGRISVKTCNVCSSYFRTSGQYVRSYSYLY